MTPYRQLYRRSIENPEAFWGEQASLIKWFKSPENILSRDEKGLYRWYSDGIMNTCYLAVDMHVEEGRGDQVALIYDSPVTKVVEKFTYKDLQKNVSALAGGLQKLGVQKGDRVVIYMPLVPEALFSMLACARIGAVHSVVFGGFAPHELAVRIDDAQPKVIISASCGIEIDRVIAYKPMLDDAISKSIFKPQHTVILQRPMMTADMWPGRDVDYKELVQSAPLANCVPVNASDPLYILYTSGTTGKPKGILRDNGGHAVALRFSMDHIYNVKAGDVFWAASDVGWVVGHSYMVYGPLMQGCTTLLYEGKPVRTPDAGAFWRVVEQHKVNILFTAPTAFRAIKKEDPEGELLHKYDISSLHRLYLAGERCDVPTWYWATEMLKVPVIDHWWQTESGWPMLGLMMGIEEKDAKVGSANLPICGYEIDVLNEDGNKADVGEEGNIVVKMPLPPGCLPTLWNDEDGYKKAYLSKYDGYYLTGDGGYKDADGYYFVMGRIDDVINVAGHRLSTGEIEEVLATHKSIAECAVVGIGCELKGQKPVGFVVLKDGVDITEEKLIAETIALVREQIGPVASYKDTVLVPRLPKTRSGKILRKIMRFIADGKQFTIPSTIDDPNILKEIETVLAEKKLGFAFEK